MPALTSNDLPESLQGRTWKAMGERRISSSDLVIMLHELRRGPRRIMGTRRNDVMKKLLKREGFIEYSKGLWKLTAEGEKLFERAG